MKYNVVFKKSLTCSILVPCMTSNGLDAEAVHIWHCNRSWW